MIVFVTGTTLAEYAIAMAQREICRIRDHPSSGLVEHPFSLEEYITLLQKVIKLIPLLASHPEVTQSSESVLWHTDLNLGNIFVSTRDPTIIEGIIDWQSALVAPLFLQVQVPVFLEPPKSYVRGTEAPKLPANFDQLDAVHRGKRRQIETWREDGKHMKCIPCSTTGMLTLLSNLTEDCGRPLLSVGGLQMVTPFPYVAV